MIHTWRKCTTNQRQYLQQFKLWGCFSSDPDQTPPFPAPDPSKGTPREVHSLTNVTWLLTITALTVNLLPLHFNSTCYYKEIIVERCNSTFYILFERWKSTFYNLFNKRSRKGAVLRFYSPFEKYNSLFYNLFERCNCSLNSIFCRHNCRLEICLTGAIQGFTVHLKAVLLDFAISLFHKHNSRFCNLFESCYSRFHNLFDMPNSRFCNLFESCNSRFYNVFYRHNSRFCSLFETWTSRFHNLFDRHNSRFYDLFESCTSRSTIFLKPVLQAFKICFTGASLDFAICLKAVLLDSKIYLKVVLLDFYKLFDMHSSRFYIQFESCNSKSYNLL